MVSMQSTSHSLLAPSRPHLSKHNKQAPLEMLRRPVLPHLTMVHTQQPTSKLDPATLLPLPCSREMLRAYLQASAQPFTSLLDVLGEDDVVLELRG